jgi:hypothetical protein
MKTGTGAPGARRAAGARNGQAIAIRRTLYVKLAALAIGAMASGILTAGAASAGQY